MSKRNRSPHGDQKGDDDVRQGRREGEAAQGPARPTEAATAGTAETSATATRPTRWWDLFPGRREYELQALSDAGLEPEVIDDRERLVVRLRIRFRGERHDAELRYPDLYPYTRCELLAPTLDLGKHQNPFGGNLCLLDRSTGAWDVGDTAASLIHAQLPKVEEAIADNRPRPDLEVPQAEPISSYYEGAHERDSLILVPAEAVTLGREHRGGQINIVLARVGARLRGAVTAINGIRADLPRSVRPGDDSRAASWVRLDAAPGAPDAVLQELLKRGVITPPRLRAGEEELIGIAFPEEVAYGSAPELAWLFVRWQRAESGTRATLVRTERFDPAQQAMRIPQLSDLAKRCVALFGVGGLGAPLAHQLMQSRIGELRMVDHDLLRVGNAVRWPLGIGAAGMYKVDALAELARAQYPETHVATHGWRLGSSALDLAMRNELEMLDEILDGADLVVDATAEPGLQYLLTDAARERAKPIITVEARAGGYGGIVARYRPGSAGCFLCFKLHQEDGRFVVADDPTGRSVQPRGCADPTFTGAAFDLVPLSAQAARLTAQTLCASDAFPDAPFDVAVLRNRTDAGSFPIWEYQRIEAHARCPRCSGFVVSSR